ncbi:MAG: hypothetical protein K1X75_10275 [Leptospirales bacterium]|nr:hypothetical protein [Leptospirales bacterium]
MNVFRSIPGQIAVLLMLFASNALLAQSFRAFDLPGSAEQAQTGVRAALQKIDPEGSQDEAESLGFAWRISDRWNSPFAYNIFAGSITARNSRGVLRIEGPIGNVLTLSRVMELEGVLAPGSTAAVRGDPQKPGEKSHVVSQGLNFVAPWLGTLYNSYDSPLLTRGQTWLRFFGYFFLDAFLVAAGGTRLFSERFDSRANGGAIAVALLFPRVVHGISSANLVRGNNRLYELGYTFYLE